LRVGANASGASEAAYEPSHSAKGSVARARVERLRQSFDKTTVKADIPADIHKALWEKFLLVTAFGGVSAVSRAPIGIIRTVPETRALLQRCMEEVSA
jgi:2-dehydropantoate 2-reductase